MASVKPPYFAIITTAIFTAALMYAIMQSSNKSRTYNNAKKERDSLIIVVDTVIHNVVRYSNENAKRGKELIKKLPNEKIIIPDTTNTYKWEYLQSYSPNKVLPD